MRNTERLNILKDWKSIERFSYWLVWLMLIVLPLIFWDLDNPSEKKRIFGGWIRIMPFLVIFIVHNKVLLPNLLLKKHYTVYIVAALTLILFVNYLFIMNDGFHEFIKELFFKPQNHNLQDRKFERPPFMRHGPGGKRHMRWHNPKLLSYTYNILISILLVVFNSAMRFATQWLKQEQKQNEQEKEAVQSQLLALQHQISPHFFMNTLNNIHALIDYDKEDAKQAILRLSKMMRHLLYDSENGKVSLEKEVGFLQSYIDLMKLRLQPNVDLQIKFPKTLPKREVFSLVNISFIENAFKHGINPRGSSFIYIFLEITDDRIHLNVKNSSGFLNDQIQEAGGIGIENSRRRLKLLFDDNYQLNIYNREEEFEVDLLYPLS